MHRLPFLCAWLLVLSACDGAPAEETEDDVFIDRDTDPDTDSDTDTDTDTDTDDDTDRDTVIDTSERVDLLTDAISTAEPGWPTRTHPEAPSAFWADTTAPLPTSAWWQRLVLGAGVTPIYPMPYQVRPDGDGLHVALSAPVTSATSHTVEFEDDLVFGVAGPIGSRQVVDYDPLSVTLRWSPGGAGSMTVPIVRGMPYVSARYEGLAPVVRTGRAIRTVNGESVPRTVTGRRFELVLDGETWVVYADAELTFNFTDTTMVSISAFDGYLRAAVVTPGNATLLDDHAGAIPTGGAVSATAQGDEAELVFDWEVEGEGDLLMMRLPHHAPVLGGVSATAYTLPSVRGDMVGVTGSEWVMAEPLSTIGFRAPSGIDPERVEDVRSALEQDVGLGVPSPDPYFGGKELSRLGRLALIADELEEAELAGEYRSKLGGFLEPWLDGTNRQPLVYDDRWGGVVISLGMDDRNAGFGQGYYNDHHFHYGYHVYAAAAMAEGDPEWAETWGDDVEQLIRNYANPSGADPLYPMNRNKDWFTGHSWAAGLFDFDRNQESTSESVNAYYAIALWGQATGNRRLYDLGRLQMATEIRATHTYWQIESGNAIYPEPFASNHVVGILFDRRAEYTTFFGNNPEFIHGIQWLPYTPITEELLRPAWIAEAYPVAASGGGVEEGWRGFLIMSQGINDPDAAWTAAQSLRAYDNGNSKTNTLYWLATRP